MGAVFSINGISLSVLFKTEIFVSVMMFVVSFSLFLAVGYFFIQRRLFIGTFLGLFASILLFVGVVAAMDARHIWRELVERDAPSEPITRRVRFSPLIQVYGDKDGSIEEEPREKLLNEYHELGKMKPRIVKAEKGELISKEEMHKDPSDSMSNKDYDNTEVSSAEDYGYIYPLGHSSQISDFVSIFQKDKTCPDNKSQYGTFTRNNPFLDSDDVESDDGEIII